MQPGDYYDLARCLRIRNRYSQENGNGGCNIRLSRGSNDPALRRHGIITYNQIALARAKGRPGNSDVGELKANCLSKEKPSTTD